MQKLYTLMFALLLTIAGIAQPPAGMNGGGRPGGFTGAGMPIGHVFGKVTDQNGKGLADASVILLQSKFDTVAKKNRRMCCSKR